MQVVPKSDESRQDKRDVEMEKRFVECMSQGRERVEGQSSKATDSLNRN